MKYVVFIAIFGLFLYCQPVLSQETKNKIPSVTIRTLDEKQINTSEINNDGKPFVISFWATWCKPCVREFTSLADVYEEWQEETGMKIYAVSIDDSRTSKNVLPFISGKGWEFEFLLDTNGDFKRAMNVNLIPHTFIVNGNGEIVWQHTSFSEGGEQEIIEIIKDLIKE